MRILHVVTLVDDQSSYGGPLTVAVNQCRELRRRGHDAQILAGWRGAGQAPEEIEGVPAVLFRVHKMIPGLRFSSLFSFRMLLWLARRAGTFDAAHLHLARDLIPLLAGLRLRRASVPYVSQTHGMIGPDPRLTARLMDRLLTLRVLRHATTRFVLTEAEDGAIHELVDRSVNTEKISNGIELDLRDVEGAKPLRSRGELNVLFMARLHPRKRVMDFAEAALALVRDGFNARFTVIGPDEGDLQALERFIDSKAVALDGRLVYGGALPHHECLAVLGKADVFVLPSVDEPFPMTLLEALAAGTPAICTTSCGIAGELRRDDAALVVDPGVESLTRGLRDLLSSSRRRAALSAAGPVTARDRYSIRVVGGRLLNAYRHDQEAPA